MKHKKHQSGYERFMSLTDDQKLAEAARFDFPADEIPTRPLNAREKAQWQRIRRKLRRGRPKVGRGVKRVMISMEAGLLDRTDAFARKHHLKRSELIARAVETIIAKAS
jgi:hypothetical protein